VDGRITVRLLSVGLWTLAAIAVVAAVIEETRSRCVPGESRVDLIVPAALSVCASTCLTLWKPVRAPRAVGFGIALGVGVGALLFLFGVFSWVHDCAN
jgi:hypothetical protein